MAPEIFEMQEYDAKADIWSVGCVFYEMLGNDDSHLNLIDMPSVHSSLSSSSNSNVLITWLEPVIHLT